MREGWQTKALGEVLQRTETINPRSAPDSEFSYIDVSSVSNETFRIESTQKLRGTEAPSRARRVVRTNDVLLATIRPTLRRIAIVPAELDNQVCSTGYFVMRPKPDVDHKFLFYWILTDQFIHQLAELQKGASYPAVTDGEVRARRIAFPKLSEQRRIVAILDEAFDGIASATVNTKQNLENVRALFESHLNSLFAQKGEGWVERTLDQIATNLDSKRIPITRSKRIKGPFPYYGASGIVDYVSGYLFEGDALLISEDGANLLTRATPIAFSVSGKYWVNNHAHVLRFEHLATQRFVEFYLASMKLDQYITGAAQPKLNQRALNSIPIPLPPSIADQWDVVSTLDTLSAETRRLESLYQQKLAALEELKQSLLHHAFTGAL